MLPFVSVMIPVRNEAAYIDRCLEAVLNQDYSQERIEILIADGMSDDTTRDKLDKIMQNDDRVKVYENSSQFVANGLNLLTSHAKGEILIRVDGHCVIAPDYISKCVRYLQSGAADGVGGPMRSVGENTISSTIALAMSSKFGVGASSFRTETSQTKYVDTIPFPAYTREIVNKVGPYDEELVRNQDDEYNYRIRKAGGRLLLSSDVQSVYYSRGSLRKLWQQYFQYGFYKVRVLQKHPQQMQTRQFVPFLFVFSIIISIIFSLVFQWGWIVLVGLLSIYMLANIGVSFLLSRKAGGQHLWQLPLAYATLHISYGMGFLVGLFKFWNRWQDQQGKVKGVDFD